MVKSLIRHNAAMEGANTSVTPTEDLQLVLDRYCAFLHLVEQSALVEYLMKMLGVVINKST